MTVPNSPSELVGGALSQLMNGIDTSGMTPAEKAYHVLVANMVSSKDYIELMQLVVNNMRAIYEERRKAPDFESYGEHVKSMVFGSLAIMDTMEDRLGRLETLHGIGQ